jgi:hypothetical protein
MIYFILIVVIVLAAFITILQENDNLEQTIIRSRQIDLDRAHEQLAIIYDSNTKNYKINNTCTLVVQIVRLWIEDQNNEWTNYNTSIILQPGGKATYAPNDPAPANVQTGWFVTARGNEFTIQQ